jgi:hypothetical protein
VAADQFSRLVASGKLSANDRAWFPRWVFRYASHLNLNRQTTLPVTRESVVSFSRQLRDGGVPAWQRLQAVRAIACYRTLIHKSDQPTLDEMMRILSRAAAAEKANADQAADRQFRQTIGWGPRFLQTRCCWRWTPSIGVAHHADGYIHAPARPLMLRIKGLS